MRDDALYKRMRVARCHAPVRRLFRVPDNLGARAPSTNLVPKMSTEFRERVPTADTDERAFACLSGRSIFGDTGRVIRSRFLSTLTAEFFGLDKCLAAVPSACER